jgi:hypothetical protein
MEAGVLVLMPSRKKVTSTDATIDDRSPARKKVGGLSWPLHDGTLKRDVMLLTLPPPAPSNQS